MFGKQKPTTFRLQTEVTKAQQSGGLSDKWCVTVEANGFTGNGEGYSLGSAFSDAYQDAVAKLLQGTGS